ncbi:hypothetical protein [uncultured Dokdonia sp.]|uniref:hypothetical protein n=1 Tax=uncultured Dokdonia sp. TaxID=575653 RepID=UPI002603065A|nr:hypothetical protein [uncultured Dokdonia sp.]
MTQLKTSGLFEIVGPEKKALQKWNIETEMKRARKEERIVVAKRMKKKGYDTATIKELTRLSVTAIGKL